MAASTADLNSSTKTLDALLLPIAAATNIWLNENVGFNSSGYIVPMGPSATLVFMGYAQLQQLNTGANGAISVPVNLINSGVDGRLYVFDCSGATQGWCGTVVYFTDDHTVAQSASPTQNIAGLVVQFLDSTHIVVDVGRRSAA